MAGSKDLEGYRDACIHAVQTTSPISRSGILSGMVSTHSREAHEVVAMELARRNGIHDSVRSLYVLGRLAAGLIERNIGPDAKFEAAFSSWSPAATRKVRTPGR